MKIEISTEFFKNHLQSNVDPDSYLANLESTARKYGSTDLQVEVSKLTLDQIQFMYEKAKEIGDKSLMSKISAFRSTVANPETATVPSLKALQPALVAYFKKNYINGWVFKTGNSGFLDAYLVTNIKYDDNSGYNRTDSPPTVTISLIANSSYSDKFGLYKKDVTIYADDVVKKTVPGILAKFDIFHETAELHGVYSEQLAQFQEYQPQFNKQFLATGVGLTEYTWRDVAVQMNNTKVINEEATVRRKFEEEADASFWRSRGVEDNFDKIPYHMHIRVFNLSTHEQVWVHTTQLTPYVYKPELREKLVLPEVHRDLIDVLVEDMDILMDDIIEGKSGGTTILCSGMPGTGKTLSAEVYSEVIQKPLYRVHSGQLGIGAGEVEKNLEIVLKRSARWGAVLLIDEADVYIRQRGNDLEHNAVVAAFLRTLEYFSGLLFMTTNRSSDVDDAILSRCIAHIKYEAPNTNNAKRIWEVLMTQFGLEPDPQLVSQLVEKFPKATGRDIKELLKLTSRYAKAKEIPLNLEVFRKNAQFRAIEMVD
ncbi:ATP-dependent zinc metalloprotease FtsH 2 [compost metagenome]